MAVWPQKLYRLSFRIQKSLKHSKCSRWIQYPRDSTTWKSSDRCRILKYQATSKIREEQINTMWKEMNTAPTKTWLDFPSFHLPIFTPFKLLSTKQMMHKRKVGVGFTTDTDERKCGRRPLMRITRVAVPLGAAAARRIWFPHFVSLTWKQLY